MAVRMVHVSFHRRLREMVRSDDGAITVDWVVLTAAACFFSIGIVLTIQNAATDKASGVGTELLDQGSRALKNK